MERGEEKRRKTEGRRRKGEREKPRDRVRRVRPETQRT